MGDPIRRPATCREKRQLIELIDPNRNTSTDWRVPIVFLSFFVGGVFWFLTIVVLHTIFHTFPDNVALKLLEISPVIMLATMFGCDRLLLLWTPRFIILRSCYGHDYLDGEVMVYHYTATAALYLIEYRTERSVAGFINRLKDRFVNNHRREGYYIDIGDGKLLFLTGSYLTRSLNNESFPCAEFKIIRLPRAGKTLEIECIGSQIDPERIQVLSDVKWENIPQDFSEVTGSFESIAGQIMHNR